MNTVSETTNTLQGEESTRRVGLSSTVTPKPESMRKR